MPITYTVKLVINGQTSSILTTKDEQLATVLAKSLVGNRLIEEVRTEKHTALTESTVEARPKE